MPELLVEVETRQAGAPRHLAIIMDGNQRWAANRHLPRAAGHRAGAKNVKAVASTCADLGIQYLTLFAFSTENWNRPKREVNLLMGLMHNLLENDIDELDQNGVRLRIIGDRSRLSADLQVLMNRAEQLTKNNQRLYLSIAVNYGGRWDITQAAKRMAKAVRDGDLDPDDVEEQTFAQFLSLGSLPPPDLCIRTGGDRRISNFLLWDFAYTELYFTEDFWPDFDDGALQSALTDYGLRRRRFGSRV
ncbi:MAG: polyprenyl diphosphate synthase [Gammaproteobacteria bacterium]|nr:polyprenyl diphosphate synthase [Gammaproteobacteria bacterium]